MEIRIFQVDAFTSRLFGGNPAAVCPLDQWLEVGQLQSIAAENNLSETAFFVPGHNVYDLRWFTPTTEVELCGHATLASAFVIWNYLDEDCEVLEFNTRSGLLSVRQREDLLVMSFPARAAVRTEAPESLLQGLGTAPREVWSAGESPGSGNYMAVYEREDQVRTLKSDLGRLAELEGMGAIVTAAGTESDFVSRYFAPSFGIPEDPVTGSTHCTLIPYWSQRLDKKSLHALQVSSRGGEIFCEYATDDIVIIGGRAVCYMEGTISL